jgi:site-specific DNA recombinase
MEKQIRKEVAIYARVSSDQQVDAGTIKSQISALLDRVNSDGLKVPEELKFIDDGYSGATLLRPDLERLRDTVYSGILERIYVHSPDRLSRKYAYQILLIDEFKRAGVEVVFLNGRNGESPEDELLLQVQGVVAEYERAKILERSRRGKMHAAKQGDVSVMAGAPYGYRFISKKTSEDGVARYEIVFEEARVVQRIFEWMAKDRITLYEASHRLTKLGVKTRTGKTLWQPKTVLQILKNTAYIGEAAFGKTRQGPRRSRVRAAKGQPEHSRIQSSTYGVPEDEWIRIPVPPLITPAIFQAVQEQLAENRSKARTRKVGARYLLQGLIACKLCGHAYYGKPCVCGDEKELYYEYYRCLGRDGYRYGGSPLCMNKPVRGDLVEEAVWKEVLKLLQNPSLLEKEYNRRLSADKPDDIDDLTNQQTKLRTAISRMIDSYSEGLIDKSEFEPRVKRARLKLAQIESQMKKAADTAGSEGQLRLLIVRLSEFSSQVLSNLQTLDWETKRNVIRAVVKRIDVDNDAVNVTFRLGDFEMPKTGAG